MREFTKAVKAVVEAEEPWIEFKVTKTFEGDEKEPETQICRAVSIPSDGQIAFLMANTAGRGATQTKVAALLNFFDSTLDDETHDYITDRLLDPQDEFGMEDIQDILEMLMEEWTARPTKRQSGSTPTPPTTGQSSTPTTPVLTS